MRIRAIPPGPPLPPPLLSGEGGPHLLTGLQVAALWGGGDGVLRLLAPGRALPSLHLALEGGELPSGDPVGRGPGRASRVVRLPGGGRLVEEVVLSDTGGGILLRWSLVGGPGEGVTLRVALPGAGSLPESVPVQPGGAAAVALLPAGLPEPPALLVPAVEARRREGRGGSDDPPLALTVEGNPRVEVQVAAAVQALDDAALDEDADGSPSPPFLVGADAGRGDPLLRAEGAALAELGLGALAAGRRESARGILRALAAENSPPALPLLTLAASWGLHTGKVRLLQALRPALEAAAAEPPPPGLHPPFGVAFPSLPRALQRLADAVEPAGDPGWTAALRERAAGLAEKGAVRRLPVLGAPNPSDPSDTTLFREPDLPPLTAFGHPDDPGFLPRRMLHAARLLRSLVEGLLGLAPDASYGRVRLAPAFPRDWRRVEVSGLRAGEARIDLGYRFDGEEHTFVLRPTGGRVPPHLIFEPVVAHGGSGPVLLEGEEVAVERTEWAGLRGIRFQFPLEGERTVTLR